MILIALVSTLWASQMARVRVSSVHVFEKPGGLAAVIGELGFGADVQISSKPIKVHNALWYRIAYKDKVAYIIANALDTEELQRQAMRSGLDAGFSASRFDRQDRAIASTPDAYAPYQSYLGFRVSGGFRLLVPVADLEALLYFNRFSDGFARRRVAFGVYSMFGASYGASMRVAFYLPTRWTPVLRLRVGHTSKSLIATVLFGFEYELMHYPFELGLHADIFGSASYKAPYFEGAGSVLGLAFHI